MSFWRRLLDRYTGRVDQDLDRELRAHLDLEAGEQHESGLPPDEAQDAARRAFGNVALVKEDTRAMWGWTSVETLWQDLRYALRTMRNMPGFTAVVVISLALGIGLTSSVFSGLNALLLRPLPVPEPGRLVRIFQGRYGNTSYRNRRDRQPRTATLASLSAFSWPNPVALGVPADGGEVRTEQVWSAAVSASYFDVLGVRGHSKKKEYVEWITETKTDATRDKRLGTTIEWLAAGKARNWKYEKC